MTRDEEKALDLANDEYYYRLRFSTDRQFTYKGLNFRPVGNIVGGYVVRAKHCDFSDIIKVENYNYKDFYKTAKQHKASCDLFEINGKLYMPCNAGFVSVGGNPKIKYIDEYKRWYQ